MIVFSGNGANDVWKQAVDYLRSEGEHQISRDQDTREILHGVFVINDPRQRVVFERPINPAFAISEVIWIMAGSNDLNFLNFWNPRMKSYSDDMRSLHGAYGYRLRGKTNLAKSRNLISGKSRGSPIDQIKLAYETLKSTAHSRQVVLQIWDSELDLPNPDVRSKDIPCNLVSHLMIRNGKLEWLQVMRSNDLVWGTPYNFIQFTTMQELFAGWLNVDVGAYVQVSDSLHVYERHWDELDKYQLGSVKTYHNTSDLRIGSFAEWEILWGELVDVTLALSQSTSENKILSVYQDTRNMPASYRELTAVLAAEALRRRGFVKQASELIQEAGHFWLTSWAQWANAKLT